MTVLADRWASGRHIGSAAPSFLVRVRTGRFNRRYDLWDDGAAPIGAVIHNPSDALSNTEPWQAFWEPDDDTAPDFGWTSIPGVREVARNNNFSQNGIETATISIESIYYVAQAGGHHTRHRGYLAPLRGYVAPGRTPLTDEHGNAVVTNDWYQKLARNSQVEIYEGYGDAMKRVFVGFIDKADTQSRPGTIVVTARMGKMLTDERVFGWNKDPAIDDPVVFIDADQADDVKAVALTPSASTEFGDGDHPATLVSDGDSSTAWWSGEHTTDANTEWVEIEVPEGRYNDYGLTTYFDGMECYVSIYATPLEDGSDPQVYNEGTAAWDDLTPNDWVDGSGGVLVPGANGGRTYVVHLTDITGGVHMIRSLGEMYRLGAGSKLRLHFRDLGGAPVYRAGVRTLYARRRTLMEEAKTQRWIRVDDVADVVKVVLRWAGFKEWEVESTGIPLPKRLVVNRGMTYMDVIKLVTEPFGYLFYVRAPTDADTSLGVPVYRYNNAVADVPPVATLTDSDLLTEATHVYDESPLPYIIRVRGRESDDGIRLGGDTARRVMFTYRPPWAERVSPTEADRLAGFIKHYIRTISVLRTVSECRIAALFVALQAALEANKASVVIPANPELALDEHVALEDLGLGVTTRMWISDWRTSITSGEKRHYVQSLAGALLDTPDLVEVVNEINTNVSK